MWIVKYLGVAFSVVTGCETLCVLLRHGMYFSISIGFSNYYSPLIKEMGVQKL